MRGSGGRKFPSTVQGQLPGWGLGRSLLFEFWDLLHISGMVEARNIKFGRGVDNDGY